MPKSDKHSPDTLPLRIARRLALRSQLLAPMPKLPKGVEGTARTIEHLGYIQVDTISVVERAHHHTLWTRRADYKSSHLHQLQAIDRRVFEYWAHAASYVPIADYRYYLPRMERFRTPHGKWETGRLRAYGKHLEPVLERIRIDGPLSSKDFDSPTHKAMWHRKPTTAALEKLHLTGELMISERRGFARVYDLTERVLPSDIDTTMPTSQELGEFFVRRALQAYGVANEQDIVHHIGGATRDVIQSAIRNMLEAGELVAVAIESVSKPIHFMFSSLLTSEAGLRAPARRVSLLSPFDNLIILRNRLKRLFDFEYTLECYVPAPKRIHGYFVLPILYGEEFVGRLDAKAERVSGRLVLRRLQIEKPPAEFDSFLDHLATRLRSFAEFNGCSETSFEKLVPRRLATGLRARL